MTRDDWEQILDDSPQDWEQRLIYADWLEDYTFPLHSLMQRWLASRCKCPGPACVLEAEWYEASWFDESQVGKKWTFTGYKREMIKHNWCLPAEVFVRLSGYITLGRRDRGFHNRFAKSWLSRASAEAALGIALCNASADESARHVLRLSDEFVEIAHKGNHDEWTRFV